MERKGVLDDSAACFARKKPAVLRFCELYGFPKQKTYSYRAYGGLEDPNQLVREWQRKGHYFCSLWHVEHCSEEYEFTDEDISGYADSLEFYNWLCNMDMSDPAYDKGVEIVNWKPKHRR